ncbi:mitochondrial import inner membrane translocase subunit tim22 [Holotrichia oblita]|uniref:Mitochondrial import inner membrane translocase subunit tim22 n=1 Tax=Holotrichia oblita TaxID=644536 RepID=A0ACB9SQF3_HOLOL|nr:mitochondrial import inner membrane translocase subunit tim22 [Holotrichia oblita]
MHIYICKSDIKKMKVKNATQVFSRTVSAIMRGFALRGVSGVPVSAGDTADFLLFFDKLFDSLNASTINVVEGKELRGAVTNTSPHVEFWQYAVRYLENIKFFNRKASQPPSVKNFIFTIKRIMYLRTTLSTTTNAKFLCTRHINQDPLENFFGCIRNHGARNINPTCHSFLLSFKTLLINNFLSPHSPGANCEEDDTEGGLAELSNLLSGEPPSPVMEPTHTVNIPSTQVQVDAATYSQTYVAGYIARKISMYVKKCVLCTNELLANNETDEHFLITLKCYTSKALLYPSTTFIKIFSNIWTYLNSIFDSICHIPNLKQTIHNVVLQNIAIDNFTCEQHNIKSYLLDIIIRFFIYTKVIALNKILKGQYNMVTPFTGLKQLAFEHYRKNKHKQAKINSVKQLPRV